MTSNITELCVQLATFEPENSRRRSVALQTNHLHVYTIVNFTGRVTVDTQIFLLFLFVFFFFLFGRIVARAGDSRLMLHAE